MEEKYFLVDYQDGCHMQVVTHRRIPLHCISDKCRIVTVTFVLLGGTGGEREGGREEGREGEREGEREGGREGGREKEREGDGVL